MSIVPFNDLSRQYQALKTEIDQAIHDCLHEGWFIGGSRVTEFENQFADYISARHVVGCGNCTDGLEIILRCLGITPGDEVIVPALTWISDAAAVNMMGAKPVFSDVDPYTYTLKPDHVKQKINSRSKAIIAVHLYGQCADMEALREIANTYQLYLIEDCAQAHGAKRNNKCAGTLSDAAAFSFYPSKNLGALGDAGCMVTNNDSLAMRLRQMANHGQPHKDKHEFPGRNSRLDVLQAAVLSFKLKHLNSFNQRRRQIAHSYNEAFKNLPIQLPIETNGNEHVYHIYAIRTDKRDELRMHLAQQGVETAVHYPHALSAMPFYSYANDCVEAVNASKELLSLPIFPELREDEIEKVVAGVRSFF